MPDLEEENQRLRALLGRHGIDSDADENRPDYYERMFELQARARAMGRHIGTDGSGWREAPYGFVAATEHPYPSALGSRSNLDSWHCHHMHAGSLEALECALAEVRRLVVGGEPAVCNNGPECPEEECRRDRWLRTISRA